MPHINKPDTLPVIDEPVDYENPWMFGGVALVDGHLDGYQAFVYLITNLVSGRRYVGKKIFVFTKRIKQAGKKRRKIKKSKSDWQKYFGSSEELVYDIETLGKEKFSREVLWLCSSKKAASCYEVMELFKRDVLTDRSYYNTNISGKWFPRDLL